MASVHPDYPEKGARSTTLGSYGYAIKCLAEGLALAKAEGWVSDDEAMNEFRSHVGVIQRKEMRQRQADELRREADDLEDDES